MRSFHYFPEDQEHKKKWLLGIRRDERLHFRVSWETVVYSDHFFGQKIFWYGASKNIPRERERERERERAAIAGMWFYALAQSRQLPLLFCNGEGEVDEHTVITTPALRQCADYEEEIEASEP